MDNITTFGWALILYFVVFAWLQVIVARKERHFLEFPAVFLVFWPFLLLILIGMSPYLIAYRHKHGEWPWS